MRDPNTRSNAAGRVTARSIPSPFKAMLALCSDLDETPDRELYVDTMRFLNATGQTPFGDGLGLEVGNTIYFDMPAAQFSYWNTDDRGRSEVRTLIKSGHIDCLHSYGDLAATRTQAGRALDELVRHDCRLEVWIDHAVAPTNFGADIMQGSGDVPGAPAYHADLTCGFGIRYVWRGRVTSVIGQDVPRRLTGIFDPGHPLASAVTLAKEASKGLLARGGHAKYQPHGANRVCQAARLRDGQPVVEFLRANPHFGGVSRGETATGVGEVLTESMLRRLEARGGATVIYTHLGKVRDRRHPFTTDGLAGLRRLSAAHLDRRLLVTTTRRLLGYARLREAAVWTAHQDGEQVRIDVTTGGALHDGDLDGLSFYVDDPAHTRLTIDRRGWPLQAHPADETGRPSVSIPWRRLAFPL